MEEDELRRILERQRRERQRFYENAEELEIDGVDDDVVEPAPRGLKRPPVPDMRFEQQFNKSIAGLKGEGASPLQIFYSAVLVNQFVMPFVNGFSWGLLGHLWRWYRVRSKYPATATAPRETSSSVSSYTRGLKYGISQWFR